MNSVSAALFAPHPASPKCARLLIPFSVAADGGHGGGDSTSIFSPKGARNTEEHEQPHGRRRRSEIAPGQRANQRRLERRAARARGGGRRHSTEPGAPRNV